MKTVQSLTLVMAVMVYAAAAPTPTTTPPTPTPTPTPKTAKELLGEIKEKAGILKNETSAEALNVKLPRLTAANQPTCVNEFFCLAEKVLKKKETKSHLNNVSIENLTRQLHQYNQLQTNITCSLHKHGHISLKKFLGDIEECCEQRIMGLKHKL